MLFNTEKRWISKIQSRADKNAANELILKYYKEIYAYVYKQTTDKETSMDITQEIFISMLKSIDGYDEKKSSFRTWLYKIATYKVIDYFRSRQYKEQSILIDIESIELSDGRDLIAELENADRIKEILKVVNHCEIQSQEIFRMKIFAGCTFSQIACILDFPESTIKTKYYALIKKIKKEMEI
ncbi:MAG: RNA polymerase sigma factor [Ruminiclostridium sp.]